MTLEIFFQENPKVGIGFSGGVDSSYLLYAALQAKADVTAYYVKSAFQPEFEFQDAKRLAEQLGARMKVLTVDVLGKEAVVNNCAKRCYYCKTTIFSEIVRAAKEDGIELLVDGTNASDEVADRPGMQALKELEVRSPLREAGLTKEQIRKLSKEAGLFTWNKPAYACLATRIPTGKRIEKSDLERTEWAEDYLFSLGFSDFRVRLEGNSAKLQLPEEQLERLLQNRTAIVKTLKEKYQAVFLDLETRA